MANNISESSFLFTIIIPTYNRREALIRCLNSLKEQLFDDFEVIVCDDGSQDGSAEAVSSFTGLSNLRYNRQENWGGPARPRNLGLECARGKWVCFLDSDDWYAPGRLQYLSTYVNSDFDVYYHRLTTVDPDGREGTLPTWQIDNKNPAVDLLTGFNGILTSSSCINRVKLLEHQVRFSENKAIIGLEDFDFWVRLGFIGFRFKFIDQGLGYYNVGGNDHISFGGQRQIDRFSCLYMSYQDLLPAIAREQSLAAYNYQKACLLQQAGDKKNAFRCFLTAFRLGRLKVRLRSLYKLIRIYI